MSKNFFAALALVLGTASLGFANDPYNSFAYGNGADVFGGAVPSGLRFGGGDVMTVRTGDVEGNVAGGCNSCGAIGCLDWKLNTWYGSWDGHGHGHGCRRGCGY